MAKQIHEGIDVDVTKQEQSLQAMPSDMSPVRGASGGVLKQDSYCSMVYSGFINIFI